MLKILYAGCFGLFSGISSQFILEMCVVAKNCEKFIKTHLLRVQGRSRSLMLINLKSLSPVLVMTSSMFVSICNRFHTTQACSGKNNVF